jgi:integrase
MAWRASRSRRWRRAPVTRNERVGGERKLVAAPPPAGVVRYAKPLHTLRKSCITDWAGHPPAHVVREWAGHSDKNTTDRYYLKVSEGGVREGSGAIGVRFGKKLAKNGQNQAAGPDNENRRQCVTDGG